jgi:hypothetical protein
MPSAWYGADGGANYTPTATTSNYGYDSNQFIPISTGGDYSGGFGGGEF